MVGNASGDDCVCLRACVCDVLPSDHRVVFMSSPSRLVCSSSPAAFPSFFRVLWAAFSSRFRRRRRPI